MANSDDLDEYDAGLELTLKKEYADVFKIFSYCVVTDEATYLCNDLSVDCVPHAAYLLFELDLKDVWVWDRNRPTRIIPRAHVFTTGDVTVEQLKGSEDELEQALPSGILDQLRTHLVSDSLPYDIDEDSDDGSAPGQGNEAGAAGGDDAGGGPTDN
ncbi:MAG: DUF2469 family protein [Thermoleophilia bacterium]|nr:DUF2469 family protein [Thermoleophilia bacterium]